MPMSATVVCNNILKRAFSESVAVSPMKLQKLLYFVSCEYVKATGNDLFSEDFGVWQYGPVLPTVYDEFKSFKSTPINKYATEKFNMEQINNGIYVNTFNTVGIPKIIGSLILNKVGISATRDTLFICADLHINNMTINIAV